MAALSSRAENRQRILVVDDEAANAHLMVKTLAWGGFECVQCASSGEEALHEGMAFDPDLVLLDLHMPNRDGYEVLRALRTRHATGAYLPILVFTADITAEARNRALELGASDFITKPGDATEIILRIKNFLTMRAWHLELQSKNRNLESIVRERTAELEEAQLEIVERLAMAGEHRDDDTGAHTRRVGELSALIALELGLPERLISLIGLAARLHDLGKIGISDAILLKKGKLSDQEISEMRKHCSFGAEILSGSKTPLMQMAERIAAAHHERFDGKGYPNGLRGEEIPIEARIVAVADVFDALTQERSYKRAWRFDEAVREIHSCSGTQFDPLVVEAFLSAISE